MALFVAFDIAGKLQWLADTEYSTALRGSTWGYPIVESVHVLTLCLFVGFATLVDLRLLGKIMTHAPVSKYVSDAEKWLNVGFVLMVASGLLLFYAKPVDFYNNIFFKVKMVLLVVAGLNVLVFHTGVYRSVATWEMDPIPPPRARFAGAASLFLWTVIIVLGRMIAYNWFNHT